MHFGPFANYVGTHLWNFQVFNVVELTNVRIVGKAPMLLLVFVMVV